MKSWVEIYPHYIYASVLLKDNKIINWKIGKEKWENPLEVTRIINVPYVSQDHEDEHLVSTYWIAENSKDHTKIFDNLAKEWLKQWKSYGEYKGTKEGKRIFIDKVSSLKQLEEVMIMIY